MGLENTETNWQQENSMFVMVLQFVLYLWSLSEYNSIHPVPEHTILD